MSTSPYTNHWLTYSASYSRDCNHNASSFITQLQSATSSIKTESHQMKSVLSVVQYSIRKTEYRMRPESKTGRDNFSDLSEIQRTLPVRSRAAAPDHRLNQLLYMSRKYQLPNIIPFSSDTSSPEIPELNETDDMRDTPRSCLMRSNP